MKLEQRFITPSGRTWIGAVCRTHGERCVRMTPQGLTGFGGVKTMHVDRERIERGDRTWREVKSA